MTGADQKGPESRRADNVPEDLNKGLKYFGNRVCPYAHRAWWAIEEKGLDVDYIHIDLGPEKPQWYTEKVNSYGTVPALYDNGKAVFESLIVAEYVADAFPEVGESLLPSDPWERAYVREFIAKLDFKSFFALLCSNDLEAQPAQVAALTQELERLDKFYAKFADRGPYLLGDRISLGDIALFPFIDRFEKALPHYREVEILPENNPNTENLRRAAAAIAERPAFKKTTQPAEVYIPSLLKFAKKSNSELRAEQ